MECMVEMRDAFRICQKIGRKGTTYGALGIDGRIILTQTS
jgi:hypothetical protein